MKFLPILLALAVTSGAAERYSLKHKHIPSVASSLNPIGDLEQTNVLHLDISLPLRNQDKLDALIQQQYNPQHPEYKHWLTPDQFADRFGPDTNEYAKVEQWVTNNIIRAY